MKGPQSLSTTGSTGTYRHPFAEARCSAACVGQSARGITTDVGCSWLPLYHDLGARACSLPAARCAALVGPDDGVHVAVPWLIGSRTVVPPPAAPNFAYNLIGKYMGESRSTWNCRMTLNGGEPVTTAMG